MKSNRSKVMLSLVTFAGVAAFTATTSFADSTNSTFATKYQANLTSEQSLWAQISPTSTDATIIALKAGVQSINAQVATLYTSEQALVTAGSSIPKAKPVTQGDLNTWNRQKTNLQLLAKTEWSAAKRNQGKKDEQASFKMDMEKYNQFEKQLVSVEKQINQINVELKAQRANGVTSTKPYDDGLLALKDSILDLQTSAITYDKEMLALQASDAAAAASTSTTASTTTNTSTSTSTTTNTSASTSSN